MVRPTVRRANVRTIALSDARPEPFARLAPVAPNTTLRRLHRSENGPSGTEAHPLIQGDRREIGLIFVESDAAVARGPSEAIGA